MRKCSLEKIAQLSVSADHGTTGNGNARFVLASAVIITFDKKGGRAGALADIEEDQ